MIHGYKPVSYQTILADVNQNHCYASLTQDQRNALAEEILESREQVVWKRRREGDRPVTRAELEYAFDLISDRRDWKNPIDAVLDASWYDEMDIIAYAVEFFTGTKLKISVTRDPKTGRVKFIEVQSPGYYAGDADKVAGITIPIEAIILIAE